MLYVFSLLGVAVCAVSGALEAQRKQMDVFGAIVVALVAALGGGTLRDVLLQHGPVFWIADPAPALVAIGVGVITFIASSPKKSFLQILLIADAGGLALFTIVGMERALQAGVSPLITLVMGVITGVAGGIGRDILCNEIPMVLRRDIYATASIAGGLVFLLLRQIRVTSEAASLVGILTIFCMRLAVIRWKLSLPAALQSPPQNRENP
ncbi:MAG TPA: trimeric intracellular cation channel family protein [Chthonomonadaceae bacterium]|nr:trimeric intracellular cation channel family protein [Chthonomonadaceae bacterium]